MFSDDHKQVKELLAFGFDLQGAINKSFEDKKFTGADMTNFLSVLPSAVAAIADLGNPWERYKRLTPEERTDLREFAFERFDLPDDELESLIEETLLELWGDFQVAQKWVAYAKRGGVQA